MVIGVPREWSVYVASSWKTTQRGQIIFDIDACLCMRYTNVYSSGFTAQPGAILVIKRLEAIHYRGTRNLIT